MKKLIALVAMVTMIAVASVANAATLTVSGTLASSVNLNNCAITLSALSDASVATGTCVPTYDVNSANGYTIDVSNSTATPATANLLTNTTTADTIAALVENATTATTCTFGTECWSYLVASDDGGVVYGSDAGQGTLGTAYNTGEHSFPADDSVVDGVITDGTSGDVVAAVLTVTANAAVSSTTDAGTFENTVGTMTLTAI